MKKVMTLIFAASYLGELVPALWLCMLPRSHGSQGHLVELNHHSELLSVVIGHTCSFPAFPAYRLFSSSLR